MRFQVPQFIEVEDKIFGPLTLKQFIYVAGAAGVAIICYVILPFFIAIMVALPVIALGGALAFYKINQRPLIEVLEHAFYYYIKGKLYTWKKPEKEIKDQEIISREKESPTEAISTPKLTQGKLKDLAWSLDVQESVYPKDYGRE